MPLNLEASAGDDGRRLDRILRKALRGLPLSAIHRLLRKGLVLVDGKKAGPGRLVRAGETITVDTVPDGAAAGPAQGPAAEQTARGVPRAAPPPDIVFEGAGLLAVNKPAGLAVHGKDSLGDRVLSYLGPKIPPSLSFRPGPLHRLDKPSSGLIVFSASLEGARLFSALLRERKIRKLYLALVEGYAGKAETWHDSLRRDKRLRKTFTAPEPGGDGPARPALTRVTPLAHGVSRGVPCTLILAEIETGRTHQIRAQAAAHGHPLLGDRKYGGKPFPGSPGGGAGFLLHAWRMEFPAASGFPRLLEAPLPDYSAGHINALSGRDVQEVLPPP